MKTSVYSVLALASLVLWFPDAAAASRDVTARNVAGTARILSSVHYYAYGGDPQAVSITVTVYDNYQGDHSKYQWIYEVVNNSYDPYTYPFASNGFSGLLLYLDYVDPNEIGDIASPGPGWVIGAQYSLPINWDIIDADGILPGGSGTFSFTTYPRYTATMEGYFNTRWFGIPVKPVYFTTSDGPEGPGALIPPPPTGTCCVESGECSVTTEASCTGTWTEGATCDPNPCPLPCVPTPPGCSNPRAYIIWAYGIPSIADLFRIGTVRNYLSNHGWEVVPTKWWPDFVTLCQSLRNDQCTRGLYVMSEGMKDEEGPGIAVIEGGEMAGWRPVHFAQCLAGVQLSNLTISACYQTLEPWQADFPGVTVRVPRRRLADGSINAAMEWHSEWQFHHGTPSQACDPMNAVAVAPAPGIVEPRSIALEDTTECSSFSICEASGCGQDLYPVIACSDEFGLTTDGLFSIGGPEMDYAVTFYLPADYADSVAATATLFTRVPAALTASEILPLGRHLLFAETTRDSLVQADSVCITMSYRRSEIDSAGILSESSLRVYWVSQAPDSGRFLSCIVDTVQHQVTFTSPAWGLAGIYGLPAPSGVDDSPSEPPSIKMLPPFPNPTTGTIQLKFRIAVDGQVHLGVYDVSGREIKQLVEGLRKAGWHSISWDGSNNLGAQLAPGVYFARLKAPGGISTKRIIVLR